MLELEAVSIAEFRMSIWVWELLCLKLSLICHWHDANGISLLLWTGLYFPSDQMTQCNANRRIPVTTNQILSLKINIIKTYINCTELPARFVIAMMMIIIIMHRKLLITDRTLFIKPRTKRLLRLRFGIDCLHPDVAMERGKSKGNCEGCMNVWLIDSIFYQRSFNAELLQYDGQLSTRKYK
jgi:hypothetical protein